MGRGAQLGASQSAVVSDSLERQARAHRLLLEAEVRLQTGGERDEESLIPLATALLQDILAGSPAIVCYTFETEVNLHGESELRLRWRYGSAVGESVPAVAPVPLLLDGDIAAHTAQARQPRLWEHPADQANGQVPRPGTAPVSEVRGGPEARGRFSILSVPILTEGILLGVINAYRPAAFPFDADDLQAVTIFAGGLAVALHNARLTARLIEAEARARELVEYSPDTIILHTTDGRILEANGAAGELVGLAVDRLVGSQLAAYFTPEERVRLQEQLNQVAETPPPYPQEQYRFCRADGDTGILQLRTRRLKETDQDGAPLLQSIVRDVTTEEKQRRALELKVRELDMLIGVGESLNSSLHIDAVLRETLRTLMSVIACPTALICLYDERRQLLLPVGIQGWPAGEPAARPIKINDRPIGAAVHTGEIVFIPDIHAVPGAQQMKRADSPRSMLVVPFMRGSDPLGAVILLRPLGANFGEEERRLAAAVARQTAIAIDNARLFGRVKRQLKQIKDLQDVTADLVADLDLDLTLDRVCQTLANLLGAEKTAVCFVTDAGDELTLAAHHGYSPQLVALLQLISARAGEAGEALRTNDCVVTPDLRRAQGLPLRETLLAEGIVASCTVPITGKGRASLGVLQASWSSPHQPSTEEIEVVRTYANYAAVAIENGRLYNRTRELYLAGVQSLAATVDARDAYTHRHSRNVAFYAREMARELALPNNEVETIELAALLHDIGKIGISDAILGKPGKLSPAEMSMMISHAKQGAEILSVNAALSNLVPLVKHHHEWYNGSGYPDGLVGEAIPLGAAIISVADAFDTMTTDRAYRRARTLDVARQELLRGAGRQFNPRVVEGFMRVLERDEILQAAYLQSLRDRGTASLPTGDLTLAEGTQKELIPLPAEFAAPGAGQIQPHHLKELKALHHLARTISAITDLDKFLDAAVDLIKRELGYTDCAIMLREDDIGELVTRAVSGFDITLRGRRAGAERQLLETVLMLGRLQNVANVQHEPHYRAWIPTNHSALLAPLFDNGQPIGVIVIESSREGAFSADDELTLETIANQLSTGIAVARLHDREKRAAVTDGLTGAFNHRYFYQKLEQELSAAQAASRSLTVIVMDVNGLKALNDTQGHLAGDNALRQIAAILRSITRDVDTVARYGGDEFAVILPEATDEDAERLIARLRTRLYSSQGLNATNSLGALTVSAGIAVSPGDGERASSLVAAADERMYAQKRVTKARANGTPDPRAEHRRRVLSQLQKR